MIFDGNFFIGLMGKQHKNIENFVLHLLISI